MFRNHLSLTNLDPSHLPESLVRECPPPQALLGRCRCPDGSIQSCFLQRRFERTEADCLQYWSRWHLCPLGRLHPTALGLLSGTTPGSALGCQELNLVRPHTRVVLYSLYYGSEPYLYLGADIYTFGVHHTNPNPSKLEVLGIIPSPETYFSRKVTFLCSGWMCCSEAAIHSILSISLHWAQGTPAAIVSFESCKGEGASTGYRLAGLSLGCYWLLSSPISRTSHDPHIWAGTHPLNSN